MEIIESNNKIRRSIFECQGLDTLASMSLLWLYAGAANHRNTRIPSDQEKADDASVELLVLHSEQEILTLFIKRRLRK